MNTNNLIQLVNILQNSETQHPQLQPQQLKVYLLPLNQLPTLQNANPIFFPHVPMPNCTINTPINSSIATVNNCKPTNIIHIDNNINNIKHNMKHNKNHFTSVMQNKCSNPFQKTPTISQTLQHIEHKLAVKHEKHVRNGRNQPNVYIRSQSRNKYKCDVCFKSFSIKNNMIMHRRIHSGTNPYQYVCTICHISYKTKVEKNNHMKKLHPMIWEIRKKKML
eukprot:380396_1